MHGASVMHQFPLYDLMYASEQPREAGMFMLIIQMRKSRLTKVK